MNGQEKNIPEENVPEENILKEAVQEKFVPEKPEENRDIIYYYSREHRLNKASQAVRELNEKSRGRPGLVKAVAGSRSNLLLLMSILVICIMYFVGTRFTGQSDSEFMLGNNNVSISIYREDTVLFLFIQKEVHSGAYAYTGAVDIAVSPVQSGTEEVPVQTHRIFFSLESLETYLVSLPFDDKKFAVIFHTDNETVVRTITESDNPARSLR